MEKVVKPIAKFVFGAFIVGMFLLVVSLTFGALGRIFPNSFANQIVGLVLFDIAAIAWGMSFVYQSESVWQYGISAIGFLVGLVGTIAMIVADVTLSASGLVTPPEWMGQLLVYAFIAAAAIHLILGYLHAGTSPKVMSQIRLGAAQAEITSEAIRLAENQLEGSRTELGNAIRPRLIADIKRNLNLPMSDEEHKALNSNGYHAEEAEQVIEADEDNAPKLAIRPPRK